MENTAEFAYKCSDFYHPGDEGGIRYDDPEVGIGWPETGMKLNIIERDLNWKGIAAYRARKDL